MPASFYVHIKRSSYFKTDWPMYLCYLLYSGLGIFLLIRGVLTYTVHGRIDYVGIPIGVLMSITGITIVIVLYLARPSGRVLVEVLPSGNVLLTAQGKQPHMVRPRRIYETKKGETVVVGAWNNRVILPRYGEQGENVANAIRLYHGF